MSVLHLSVKTGDAEFPYEGRYSSELTLLQLKKKLEMVVGIPHASMKLSLHDNTDKFVSELNENDDLSLTQLNIVDKSIIHVKDTTGSVPLFNTSNDDVSLRYKMDDVKYEARDDSVRKWMKELGVDKTEVVVPDFARVGNRCVVCMPNQPDRTGSVAFVGPTHFKPGTWIGVVYDEPVGKNDGTVDGQRYFICEPKHGGFVSPKCIFPATTQDDGDASAHFVEIEEI